MFKRVIDSAKAEGGNLAADWVVLAAGAVSVCLAFAIAFTHNNSMGRQVDTLASAGISAEFGRY
ncbi:MAG: hypothetical protein CSA68_09430 [Rhodobacterales bacterium]|nr:MAG: hypothetical protein CSA68_09430 [Rhodobacterales bacterium]